MPKALNKIISAIHYAEDSAIVILVITMIVLSGSSLVLRNIGFSGLTWAETAIRISVLWLAMFGALRASREQSHIGIDLITHYTPEHIQRYIHFLVSITSAAICGTASYYSYLFILSEKEEGMIAFLDVPVWLCEAIIPFGLAIITLRFIIHSLTPPKPHELTV
jgi:TRAP-type C4-dicarboxylate transport system permease small subunit